MRQRTTKVRAGVLLLFLGSVVACAQNAYAWSYHSFTSGYSLALPDDWVQIPEEELTLQRNESPALRSSHGAEVAFQPKRNSKWLEYPFIVVEVVPYSKIGFPQQVTDDEARQIIASSTGLDPLARPIDDSHLMEGGAELEPQGGLLRYDQDHRRFLWVSQRDLQGAGKTRLRQWGFFGKDVLVQVTLYERGTGSDRLRDLATAVAGSFKFEIGREYQPALTLNDVLSSAKGMFSTPTNSGMLVTLGCVGTALLFAVVALASSRKGTHTYRHYNPYGD